jgi:hypothetical protein
LRRRGCSKKIEQAHPDAKIRVSYVGTDPILWIGRSLLDPFSIPVLVWDEDFGQPGEMVRPR